MSVLDVIYFFLFKEKQESSEKSSPIESSSPIQPRASNYFGYKAISDPNLVALDSTATPMSMSSNINNNSIPRNRSMVKLSQVDNPTTRAISEDVDHDDFDFIDFDEAGALVAPAVKETSVERINTRERISRQLSFSLTTARLPSICVSPERDLFFQSSILRQCDVDALTRHLPVSLRNDSWKLLYSIVTHGSDFGSFYSEASGWKHTLLVVMTNSGEVFGGFASEAWKTQRTHMFYGTGESFLFKVLPPFPSKGNFNNLNILTLLPLEYSFLFSFFLSFS